MFGKVHMFNDFDEEMGGICVQNVRTAETIPALPANGGTKPMPYSMVIERVEVSTGEFAFQQGRNLVTFFRPTQPDKNSFEVHIPSQVNPSDDLNLVVRKDDFQLTNLSGTVLDSGKISH